MKTISERLGYPNDDLEPTIPASRQQSVTELCQQLDNVDSLLENFLADSMAVKVGDLSLDYRNHHVTLLLEGSRLLKRLARVVGLDIIYDPYKSQMEASESTLQVRSYW